VCVRPIARRLLLAHPIRVLTSQPSGLSDACSPDSLTCGLCPSASPWSRACLRRGTSAAAPWALLGHWARPSRAVSGITTGCTPSDHSSAAPLQVSSLGEHHESTHVLPGPRSHSVSVLNAQRLGLTGVGSLCSATSCTGTWRLGLAGESGLALSWLQKVRSSPPAPPPLGLSRSRRGQ
jgi:hypothetical protein